MEKYSILLSIILLNFLAGTAIFATTYTCPTLLPGGTYRDGQIMPGNNGNQWSLGMRVNSVTISRDKPFQ